MSEEIHLCACVRVVKKSLEAAGFSILCFHFLLASLRPIWSTLAPERLEASASGYLVLSSTTPTPAADF